MEYVGHAEGTRCGGGEEVLGRRGARVLAKKITHTQNPAKQTTNNNQQTTTNICDVEDDQLETLPPHSHTQVYVHMSMACVWCVRL